MPDPFATLIKNLQSRNVRYVVIGVWGANYYSPGGAATFRTRDRDLFLPPDPSNLAHAWQACEESDVPRDLDVNLTLVMPGFEFEEVWQERRTFIVDGVDVPVARLLHIVKSKEAANRDKDRLFLATHEEALRQLLGREPS
jgi:hypothetical protein